VKRINVKTACKLNARWHSRLPYIHWSNVVRNTYYVCYGFFYEGKCYGVGIWSSPVAQNRLKDGKSILELRRMALSSLCPRNTASRMLKIMILLVRKGFPKIKKLISYQDIAVHRGTIYKASGWKIDKKCNYSSWTTGRRRRNQEQAISNKIRWGFCL